VLPKIKKLTVYLTMFKKLGLYGAELYHDVRYCAGIFLKRQRESRENSINTASLRVYSKRIVCFVPMLCVVGQNNSVLFELFMYH
jgi:hypothetical protein